VRAPALTTCRSGRKDGAGRTEGWDFPIPFSTRCMEFGKRKCPFSRRPSLSPALVPDNAGSAVPVGSVVVRRQSYHGATTSRFRACAISGMPSLAGCGLIGCLRGGEIHIFKCAARGVVPKSMYREWRISLKLRREQRKATRQSQLTLFELKDDRRPASQQTADGRYAEPTLFKVD
jgi:hypothetical protein